MLLEKNNDFENVIYLTLEEATKLKERQELHSFFAYEKDGKRVIPSTFKEIKKVYNSLAREYHPDKNKNEDADKIFIFIQEKYEELKKFYNVN